MRPGGGPPSLELLPHVGGQLTFMRNTDGTLDQVWHEGCGPIPAQILRYVELPDAD